MTAKQNTPNPCTIAPTRKMNNSANVFPANMYNSLKQHVKLKLVIKFKEEMGTHTITSSSAITVPIQNHPTAHLSSCKLNSSQSFTLEIASFEEVPHTNATGKSHLKFLVLQTVTIFD